MCAYEDESCRAVSCSDKFFSSLVSFVLGCIVFLLGSDLARIGNELNSIKPEHCACSCTALSGFSSGYAVLYELVVA